MRRRMILQVLACVVGAAAMAACSSSGDGETSSGSTGTTTTSEAPHASGEFSALTYNVVGLPQGINADQHPADNQPIMSPLLNEYDVVWLQEDFGSYTELLRADATHEFQSEPHPGPNELNSIHRTTAATGDGLNFLSRLPIGALDRVPWANCGAAAADCLALKGFAFTTMTLADDVTIDIYDLHMEAGSGDEDDQFRGEDLDDLAAYMVDHSAGHAVIVAGDWNLSFGEEPDGSQLRGFQEDTGLADVCDVLDCGADDDVIDRFLFRSADDLTIEPTSHVFERETFVDANGGPLSDHDPLHVDWTWTQR